jgi:uncharacterized YccA/Bax inhibitor family protein
MATSNPVLTRVEKEAGAGFAYDEGRSAYAAASHDSAGPAADQVIRRIGGNTAVTLNDVIVKTGILFVLLVSTAVVGWKFGATQPVLIMGGLFVGFGLAMANSFMKRISPPLVMLYAVVEGFVLGGVSQWYSASSRPDSNIVYQAVLGTFVAFAVMLFLYATHIIKVNGRFIHMLMIGLISYGLIAFASLFASFFGVGSGWGFYGVHGLGLLLCVAGVALASFTLAMDFESINRSITAGIPERESWRLAFGLMVTLVWLYLEILRLLAILNRR